MATTLRTSGWKAAVGASVLLAVALAGNAAAQPHVDGGTVTIEQNKAAALRTTDFHITVEAMIAEGDIVVSRYTATATDTVGYMGMPPTGKTIRTPAIQIFRFANGKIVESWAARDDLGTLRQLGHLSVPGGRARH